MTQNPNLRCPVLWLALLIEAKQTGDTERQRQAQEELRQLIGDERTHDFLEKYDATKT